VLAAAERLGTGTPTSATERAVLAVRERVEPRR
jgi:hypothetical protein